MDWLYDGLRIVQMIAGCIAVGATAATWSRPLSFTRRIRFFCFGAFAGVTAFSGFLRLGEGPVFVWRLYVDAILTIIAAISCVGYFFEPPMEPSPSKMDVDEGGHPHIS